MLLIQMMMISTIDDVGL